ncbi:MAG: BlaI/MecI/CopY family transcriptional regulator [Calditrichae bacterium]|nr:BlaI/MecI/CopY family transcriptional regulator [Calditrichota bacterium]MCB9057904.1 BlaI/MecI/CopY family transcriptional regulator [Calditrichia bacterium]
MKNIPEISRTEFEILRVLWRISEASVREVHDNLSSGISWAYSTTKTTMDRMVKKGLLDRSDFHGVFVYSALVTRPQGLFRWVKFIADRVLETDYIEVVALFAKNKKLNSEEIDELTNLLEKEINE